MGSNYVKYPSTTSTLLIRARAARSIESSVLTGCLLRCGRIDLMIGEQSRFVSQEYRAFGSEMQSKARSRCSIYR